MKCWLNIYDGGESGALLARVLLPEKPDCFSDDLGETPISPGRYGALKIQTYDDGDQLAFMIEVAA